MRKGRPLKVRFAPNSTAVKVKNLTQYVTNELLEKAFSIFGDVSLVLYSQVLLLVMLCYVKL